MTIKEIYKNLLAAKYKKLFFFEKSVYEQRHEVSDKYIQQFEERNSVVLSSEFKEWWHIAGCGEIVNHSLLIGASDFMFKLSDAGKMTNYIVLATDELRNYYVCDISKSEKIYICSGLGEGYCEIADSFHSFLKSLKNHDYNIYNLIENISLKPV